MQGHVGDQRKLARLAPLADHRRFSNRGMGEEDVLDLARLDAVPQDLDLRVHPPPELDVAVRQPPR
ncbi:MAG: hypothetical protein M3203_16215 [Actinomycetota bacterium]|nr:hypothetical protein [Actinomycetota bacterium]